MTTHRNLMATGWLLAAVSAPAVLAQETQAPTQNVPRIGEPQAERPSRLLSPQREEELALREFELARLQAQLEQARRRQELDLARAEAEARAVQVQRRELEREQTTLEEVRRRIEQSRLELEAAARNVATQSFSNWTQPGLLSFTATPRTRLGIGLVDSERGALVTEVVSDTPAAEAGLEVGDFITSIDGISLVGGDDTPTELLARQLRDAEGGETVDLAVERGVERLDFNLVAREARAPAFVTLNGDDIRWFGDNDDHFVVLTENLRAGDGGRGLNIVRTLGVAAQPWADMELVALTEELGRYFDTSEGLLVVRAPSDDAIDLADGDVILSIGTRTPNSPEHAMRILGSFEAGETIELRLMRGGMPYTSEYSVP